MRNCFGISAVITAVAWSTFRLAAAPQQAVEPGGSNLPLLPIGAEDLIAVSVYGAPEFSRTVRISSEGEMRLPMLRAPIRAQGLLPSALEAAIAEGLVSERILVDPVVTITLVEYRSRPISVAGAVKRPITFQALGRISLLDALTRAEGLAANAGPEILLSRPREAGASGGPALVRRIPVKGLIDAADPALNPMLEGGEEIRIPEVGKIFVVGNVRKPGAFPVEDTSDTSVLKALALTEGMLPYASKTAFIYRQEGGSGGKKTEIPIPLSKIVQRKAPDELLRTNDILYIPDNSGRRISLTLLDRIASFGSSTATGVLVWRR